MFNVRFLRVKASIEAGIKPAAVAFPTIEASRSIPFIKS
jgi:hypothetical protein